MAVADITTCQTKTSDLGNFGTDLNTNVTNALSIMDLQELVKYHNALFMATTCCHRYNDALPKVNLQF